MAAGVDQPGGAGTPITYEDDSASLNGQYYTLADIDASPFAPEYPLLGTNPEAHRAMVELVNGDGAGEAPTTLKLAGDSIFCDAGKPLQINPIGAVNRRVQLGNKVLGPNGKPAGQDGCRVGMLGSAASLPGTVQIYGSHIRCSGLFNIFPGFQGSESEIVDSNIECGGTVGLGLPSTGKLKLLYDVTISLFGTGLVGNLNADYSELVKIYGDRPLLLSTVNAVRVRRIIFGGSPTTSDARIGSATNQWDLNDVTWSGNCPQLSAVIANTAFVNLWAPFIPFVYDGYTGIKIANMPVTMRRFDGTEVVPLSYTDAQGLITYGAADLVTQDSVRVRRWKRTSGVNAFTEDGPFTARYNMDGVTLPGYLPRQIVFDWPRRTGANGDTLIPVYDGVPMVPFGSLGREEWRPQYA